MAKSEPLISVRNLKKYYRTGGSFVPGHSAAPVKAVDDVSFDIEKGEVLGLVGESGCGKSTLGLSLLRLHESTGGRVVFDNTDLFKLNRSAMRKQRQNLQMIFQDPYSSLNPRLTVSQIVSEPLVNFKMHKGSARSERVIELLELVGLGADSRSRYPHAFSGGQCQRIGIARALATNPRFIVCDESVSALDVSIQAQILNLLKKLRRKLGLTYLFISHDLLVVNHIADRIAVMYLGKIVELADKRTLFSNPLHPYTQALLSCVPVPDPDVEQNKEKIRLQGDIPSPVNPPCGCHFHPRCYLMQDRCCRESPTLRPMADGRLISCHLA